MKYTTISVLAAFTLIGLLILAFKNKQDATVAPQAASVKTTNSTITVEGQAEVSFPTRK